MYWAESVPRSALQLVADTDQLHLAVQRHCCQAFSSLTFSQDLRRASLFAPLSLLSLFLQDILILFYYDSQKRVILNFMTLQQSAKGLGMNYVALLGHNNIH